MQDSFTLDYKFREVTVLREIGKGIMATRQKNLAIDSDVCDQFEKFCADRSLIEGRAMGAAMRLFMVLQPSERERVLLDDIDPTMVQIGPKPKTIRASAKRG